MPRFVVLRHEVPSHSARASHFDLMIEQGAALRTWALDAWPPLGEQAAARSLPDHRLDYLSYEGPVSGDRGHVIRVDQGACEVLASSAEGWTVVFHGQQYQGRLLLTTDE